MEQSGYLKDKPLPEILKEISRDQITGWLSLVTEKLDLGNIYFYNGMIIYANIDNQPDRLGDDLVQQGVLTESQLQRAIRLQEEMPDKLLGSIIADLNLVPEETLRQILIERNEQTVLKLMHWNTGYFNFAYDRTPEDKYLTVLIDTEKLIKIHEEREKRVQAVKEKIPDKNIIFEPVEEKLAGFRFDEEFQKLIPLIDGNRTVDQIIVESNLNEIDVLMLLSNLMDADAIEMSEEKMEEEEDLTEKFEEDIESLKVLIETNMLEDAIELCNSIFQQYPGEPKGHFYYGIILFKKGEYARAKDEFHKVLMFEPDNLNAQINYTLTLEKTDGYDEIIKGWYRAIELAEENDAQPLINLGIFLYNHGNYSLAKNQFERANELDRDASIPYFYLGLIFAQEGNDSDSMVNFEQAYQIDTGNIKFANNTAQMMERRGMKGKAKMEYKDALEKEPSYTYARINLADWYYKENKLEEAEQEFNSILANDSRNSFSLFRLGCIFYKREDLEKAKEYWNKSLEFVPENKPLRDLVENIG